MWSKESGSWQHSSDMDPKTKGLLEGYLRHKSVVGLHALSDHLEESGHPGALIVRHAISYPEKDGTPMWFAHSSMHGNTGRKGSIVTHAHNYNWMSFRTGTHLFTFHAPHSHEQTDYLRSTGMPE